MLNLGAMGKYCVLYVICFMQFVGNSSVRAQASVPIVPIPLSAISATGSLSVDHGLQVEFEGYTEPRLDRARQRFLGILSRQTGVPLLRDAQLKTALLVIRTSGPSALVQQLGEDESYHLEITPTGAFLNAPNPLGVLHGLQTFLQLVQSSSDGFVVPAMSIEDKPRFPWRGLMIDTGRHFMPLDVLHQNLDGMEAVKMNVFHWHLSEDQGFRVESKVFPLLQEKGSDGHFYTQDQVRSIIDYARDRGIRVVPEFDMPAHATSWFVGYPQLASGRGPYQIERHWGVFGPAMDPTRETTYDFLDKFIGEMTALFPDAYFHIGGDECNGKEWDANPRIKQYMRTHQLKNDAALQAYFTGRVQKLVTAHQKITVGWDEVLQPNTPHDVVIQSWRGQKSLAEAARRGYRGILSAGYYIDLNQSAAKHYAVDPLVYGASALSPEQAANVLGGEATMWTELVSSENINTRIWPRTAAIAERLWSAQSVTDVGSMYQRIDKLSQKLPYYGVPVQGISEKMMLRLSSTTNLAALKILASVVQPPKGYAREDLRSYNAFTPLNRLVDAVPPESNDAREFDNLCIRIAAGSASPADWEEARQSLTLWRDNDAQLGPTLLKSELTAELVPLSDGLSHAGTLGLLALDALQNKQPIQSKIRRMQLFELDQLAKPQAVLIDMIVPGVAVLVRANKIE